MTPNGVERLARLFLIKESDYRHRHLMILQTIEHSADRPYNGYFDETMKDDVIGVAGWIGSYEGWNRLEYEWRKALPKEANGDFHYTDFWSRAKENYGASWSNEHRLEHVKTLAKIAHDCTSFAVGFVFSRTIFDECIPEGDRKVIKGPLDFCFAQCVAMLLGARAAKHIFPPTPWDIMFDQKKEEQDAIGQIFYRTLSNFDNENLLGNIGFSDRKHMAALQAADLLIGELRRHHAGHKSEVLEILKEKRPILVAFPTNDQFRDYVIDVQRRLREKSNAPNQRQIVDLL